MRKIFPLIILVIFVLSCAKLPPVKNPEIAESNLPPKCEIEGIKPLKQDWMGCVPTSATMVFNFYGKEIDKDKVADWMQKGRGTPINELETFARWNGFNTYVFYDWSSSKSKIKYFLSQGYPVLVVGNRGLGVGSHMILLIGYDDSKIVDQDERQSKGVFYACDPGPGKRIWMAYWRFLEFHSTFSSGQKHYCLVIYPKN